LNDGYDEFISKIKQKSGIDLQLYKEAQMKRRITSLRNKLGFADFTSYYHALINDKKLLNEFMDRLTINVTEFYRNRERWEVLKNKIIPSLLINKRKLSIWSAACSTGEEPYSLAIMMKEYFPQVNAAITATDLDENVLAFAEEGIYPEKALNELPASLKKKYFLNKNEQFKIDPSLKTAVTFKQHNLLADRYPNNMDLIVCRNVLIYFTDTAKEEIYSNLSESLNDQGVLFVGSTEQIFNPNKYKMDLIETFFYRKK